MNTTAIHHAEHVKDQVKKSAQNATVALIDLTQILIRAAARVILAPPVQAVRRSVWKDVMYVKVMTITSA